MIHVWTDIGSYINEKSVKNITLTEDTTYAEIDVSDLSGSYYIGFSTAKNNDGAATITVTSLGLAAASGGAESNIALLSLDDNPADDDVFMEVDGLEYGVNNATLNKEPTPTTYDFTVL